jgi:hypothetical protein
MLAVVTTQVACVLDVLCEQLLNDVEDQNGVPSTADVQSPGFLDCLCDGTLSCWCLNADDCNHELDHQSPSDVGEDFVDLFSGILIAVGMDLAHGLNEGFAAYVRIASIRQKFEREFVHRVDLIPYRDEIDLEDGE